VGERSQEVYERLRAEIARGDLRPNERLVEAELAERLAVSRTPVRESIARLAGDGLVVSRRRAWFVHEHTPAEIRAIYEVRQALEGYAAALAANRASTPQRREILKLGTASPGRDPGHGRFVETNARFHDAVATAARNGALSSMLAANRDLYFNRRISVAYDEDEIRAACAEHAALADAIAHGKADDAERITRQHIARSLELALRKLA
jgi:DNA-binding GntR family transcriptional regulator